MANRLKNLEGVTTSDAFRIRPDLIEIEPGFNSRDFTSPENIEHVRQLAESIRVQGVINPIVVRYAGERILLVDGESRLRATRLAIEAGAEIVGIPAITEARGVTEADRIASQVTRNSGKRFNDLELGQNFARLIGYGWDIAMIADRTNTPRQKVNDILNLHEAPEVVKQHIRDGEVASGVVASVLRDEQGDHQSAAAIVTAGVVRAKAEGRPRATKVDVTAAAVDHAASGTPSRVAQKAKAAKVSIPSLYLQVLREKAGAVVLFRRGGLEYMVGDLLDGEPELWPGMLAGEPDLQLEMDYGSISSQE